jgi:uncharacterized protein Yka (UPF0111/DUF47 family)
MGGGDMKERWARLWRDLLGRNDRVYTDLLLRQTVVTADGARALIASQRDHRPTSVIRDELVELERTGDEVRAELMSELARTLTTPIDGEDLYRLSGALDVVLDNLRDFAIELDAYGSEPGERFIAPLEGLAQGLDALGAAIHTLSGDVSDVAGPARAAKKANEAREAFHREMSTLLDGDEVTMATLRDRELLRRLDVAGLRLASAADALISGALKRG